MLHIHSQFTGGNIRVKEICDDTVVLENDLRDTTRDWFYWAFCVEGAAGRTLTFQMQPTRLGYWGPAVSHDLAEWHWLDACEGDSFVYHFGAGEDRVYFAHDMLYHPARFTAFCEEHGLKIDTLCQSRKGRSIPCLRLGEGERSIIFTARHHACESTGSYVLEGILEELTATPLENTRILAVPFVDYDGVIDGDQGKDRAPHDHNRDHIDHPIYPEIRAIRAYAQEHGVHFAFDLHSPYHKGGTNDHIFIVRNMPEKLPRFDAFSEILQGEITPDAMSYAKENDFPPCTRWNQPGPTFGYTTNSRPECHLAFTLESTYFGTPDNKVSRSRLIALGRCFARAVRKYVASTKLQ